MDIQNLFEIVDYKGKFVGAVTVILSKESDTTPLCPVYCNMLVSVCANLLVHYPELRGVRYSGVLFTLGGSAGTKARCPLDRGVHYLECPL